MSSWPKKFMVGRIITPKDVNILILLHGRKDFIGVVRIGSWNGKMIQKDLSGPGVITRVLIKGRRVRVRVDVMAKAEVGAKE